MISQDNADHTVQNELDGKPVVKPEDSAISGVVLDGPTHLYRHFDADGVLLYVGISLSAMERLRGHKNASHWFSQIAVITVKQFPTRKKALRAEDIAIALEKPLHNIRVSYAPDYDPDDADESKVEFARILVRMKERWALEHNARRKRIKKEIQAAGLESNL